MSSPSNYRECPPGPVLTEWIECFWSGAGGGNQAPITHRIVPDGCMDLIFNFGPDTNRKVSVIGTMTRPLVFRTRGPADLLGIRFHPGGLPRHVFLDASELTDDKADLANFRSPLSLDLWERLAETDSDGRIAILRQTLTSGMNGTQPIDPYVKHCVTRIQSARGSLPIGSMGFEASTGLCLRQLERKFAENLGISLKTFARVVRFRCASELAEAGRDSIEWSRLAGDFGFSDQSHLVREFRTLSGLAPTDYLAEFRRVGFLQDEPAAIE